MKNSRKIKLTVIGVLSGLFSYAQLNITLPNKVTFELPKGTVWYNDFTHTNRLADNLGLKRPSANFNIYTYKFNEMNFTFHEINSTIGQDYLKKERQSLEFDFKKEAILKDINGNHYVIAMSYEKKTGIYVFSCLNSKSTKGFKGLVGFSTLQNNQEYYWGIMEAMFKTVKFIE